MGHVLAHSLRIWPTVQRFQLIPPDLLGCGHGPGPAYLTVSEVDEEIGVLWDNEQKDGTIMMGGNLDLDQLFKWLGKNGLSIEVPDDFMNKLKIVLFRNKKATEKAPNWNIIVSNNQS